VSEAGTAVAGTITGDGGKVAGNEAVAKTVAGTTFGVVGGAGLGGAATGLGGAATGLGGAATGLGGATGLGDLTPAEAEAVVETPLVLTTCWLTPETVVAVVTFE
jgi:hypothetical protein